MVLARLRLPWLCLLVCLSFPTAAQARAGRVSAQTLREAKAHYDAGARFYDEERYAEAAKEFLVAYTLSHRTDILFNVARAEAKQGHDQEAIVWLQRYLAETPSAADAAAVRAEIEARQTSLQARIAEEQLREEAKAARLREEADRQRLSAQLVEERARTEAVAEARAKAAADRVRRPRWPGFLLVGLGGASLVAGLSLGGVALAAARSAERGGFDGSTFDRELETRGRVATRAGLALDLVGVALGGVGAGLSIWAARWRAPAASAPSTAAASAPGVQP